MSGDLLNLENPIEDAVSRIQFAPNSNNLLISSWDSGLRLYDVDRSLLRLESLSDSALLDCCFESEAAGYSVGSDGSVTRYDLHSGLDDNIGNHQDMATCVGYSSQTGQVISTGFDKKVIFWDPRSLNTITSSVNVVTEAESMSISGMDLLLATGSSVSIFDLRNLLKPVLVNASEMDVQIKCIGSLPSSKGYATGTVDGRVALKSQSKRTSYTFRCHPKSRGEKVRLVSVNDLVFSPLDHGNFVTGDTEGYLISWDAESKRRLYEYPRYGNSIASLAYNHTGHFLAVASSRTYQEAKEIEDAPQVFILNIDVSPDEPVSTLDM